jgi:hypothetical protein
MLFGRLKYNIYKNVYLCVENCDENVMLINFRISDLNFSSVTMTLQSIFLSQPVKTTCCLSFYDLFMFFVSTTQCFSTEEVIKSCAIIMHATLRPTQYANCAVAVYNKK